MLTAGPRRGLGPARSKGLQLRQSSGGTVRGSGAKRRGMRRRPRPSVVLSFHRSGFNGRKVSALSVPCARAWACVGEISHVAARSCVRAPCLMHVRVWRARAERGVSCVCGAHTFSILRA